MVEREYFLRRSSKVFLLVGGVLFEKVILAVLFEWSLLDSLD